MDDEKSILIIGRPESGKTRFLTQFCIRAEKNKSSIQFFDRADEISPITQDRNRVAQGLSSVHTPSGVNLDFNLSIEIDGQKHEINYPDSAGEQVNQMVDQRSINPEWQKQIEVSDHWILFIRPANIKKQFDLSSKVVEKTGKQQKGESLDFEMSDQGFLIELIQMMLYAKGIGITDEKKLPQLAVVLTCWDEIEPIPKFGVRPDDILRQEKVLPLFSEFIHAVWGEERVRIFGLSPQGQSLSSETPDEDYIDDGPENKGFIILPDGKKDDDITLLISNLLA